MTDKPLSQQVAIVTGGGLRNVACVELHGADRAYYRTESGSDRVQALNDSVNRN